MRDKMVRMRRSLLDFTVGSFSIYQQASFRIPVQQRNTKAEINVRMDKREEREFFCISFRCRYIEKLPHSFTSLQTDTEYKFVDCNTN